MTVSCCLAVGRPLHSAAAAAGATAAAAATAAARAAANRACCSTFSNQRLLCCYRGAPGGPSTLLRSAAAAEAAAAHRGVSAAGAPAATGVPAAAPTAAAVSLSSPLSVCCLSPFAAARGVSSPSLFLFASSRGLVEIKFKQTKPAKDTSNIPFKVLRTASGNLAVYSRIRKHGTAVTTIVRHAVGDIAALKKDLMSICEAPVRERCGSLEVKGLHVIKIKQWLVHLGF